MSVFSDTLTRYIEHKNIKVFSLAKYCNLDRSTMYKILNGKRNPPSSEVLSHRILYLSSARLTVFHWSLSSISTIMYIR